MNNAASILPLTIKDLSYSASSKSLLKMINLTLPESGVTAIIGPNGAGKSLLLRLCHGLLLPSEGVIDWQLKDGFTDGKKRHAMVFQSPVMLRRSVRANIAHALNRGRAAALWFVCIARSTRKAFVWRREATTRHRAGLGA
jgi:tungstate transport system ATP-binding protein